MRSTRCAISTLGLVATLLLGAGLAQAVEFGGFGSYISGFKASVPVGGAATGAAFDASGQVLYYVSETTDDVRALIFAPDFMSGTTKSIGLGDLGDSNPSDVVVDANGDLYIPYDYTAGLRKITDPMGTATASVVFAGNAFMGGTGDDDPFGAEIAPPGFNGSMAKPGDILLNDKGLDKNETNAIESVSPDGSGYKTMATWATLPNCTMPDASPENMAADQKNGVVYMAPVQMTSTVDGKPVTQIFTLSPEGVLTAHEITLPSLTGDLLDNVQGMTVNPLDGSIWVVDDDNYPSATYVPDDALYRIDPVTFVATLEIDFDVEEGNTTQGQGLPNFNYSIAFTPDGRYLVIGDTDPNSNTANAMMVFGVVPEPTTVLLLGIGGCLLGARRRRS
ncbi:MAG: PEP-CTERM sorting domain-containing protein [Phycisphaerae bacterium]|nr:PEP-CTERM sorting domain-containing protein [Phycisphaerae bacterium]